MKLVSFIKYLTNPDLLIELFQKQRLNMESEALIIYMQKELSLESDLSIFEIEETDDDIIFIKHGIQYVQFYPIDYAIQLLESDLELKGQSYSDLEIAQTLLDYRQKDA